MNLEFQNVEVVNLDHAADQKIAYQFVIDADLAYVGGGGGLLDY